jgi:hypothetical protein
MSGLLWWLSTGVDFASSLVVAASLFFERSAFERWGAGLLLALLSVILCLFLLGSAHLLYFWAVVFQMAALNGLLLYLFVVRPKRLPAVTALLRRDMAQASALARTAWAEKSPLVLCGMSAAVVLAGALLVAWILPTFNYDGLVYHVPVGLYQVHNHSLEWIDTNSPWISSYPLNSSFLVAWNVLLMDSRRLEDAIQIPFGIVGWLLLSAWCRRLGLSRVNAFGLGACWVLIPAVVVQLPHPQNDIVCGTLFLAGMYFASRMSDVVDAVAATICLGVFVGTKYTGAVQVLMVSPFLLVQYLRFWRKATPQQRTFFLFILPVGSILALYKYAQNLWVKGNPVYPFPLRLPLLGTTLNGSVDAAVYYGGQPGSSGMFFGVPGDFGLLWERWYSLNSFWIPDVKSGGLGLLFSWMLVPLFVAGVLVLCRQRRFAEVVGIVSLFLAPLVLPGAWWPRYTLTVVAAGLLTLAAIVAALSKTRWRHVFTCGATLLSLAGAARPIRDLIRDRDTYVWPSHVLAALSGTEASLQRPTIAPWMWPKEWKPLQRAALRPGDVVSYDESAEFVGEYFGENGQQHAQFISSKDVNRFMQEISTHQVRWVGVGAGTEAEQRLVQAGATLIGQHPSTGERLYQRP